MSAGERTSTDSDWTELEGCAVYVCRAAFIRVIELIKSKRGNCQKHCWGREKKREKKEQSGDEQGGRGEHTAGMTRVWLSSRGMKNSTSQTRRGSGRLLRQRERGCAGTTNAIIFTPALLFVRTGMHLRTWVY